MEGTQPGEGVEDTHVEHTTIFMAVFRWYCFNSCMKYLAALIILLSMKRKNQMFKKHDRKKAKIKQLYFPTQILRWFSRGFENTSVNVPIGIYS